MPSAMPSTAVACSSPTTSTTGVNGTADIYEAALPAGRIVTLEPSQSLKDAAEHFRGEPLVIDFGGFVESSIIEAAEMTDITVVPLSYQSTTDLMPAVKTINAIKPYEDSE